MRGRWLGRRKLFWIADVVLIPAFVLLALTVEDPGLRLLAWVIVGARLVIIAVLVTAERTRRRGADSPATTP